MRSLPVILPSVPNQRWSCHSCGNCCRSLVGHLFDDERRRLDEQGWVSELGIAPYVRLGREWVLNKRPDEACVFLDEKNLCRIHAKYGEAAKPLACRIFPFSVRPVGRGWQVSFRFDCPSSAASKGKPVAQYGTWLRDLVAGLPHRAKNKEDVADLQPGRQGTMGEIETVVDRFTRWIQDDRWSVRQRLVGAARLTTTLCAVQFEKVRGPRLAELLDVLLKALPAELLSIHEPLPSRPAEVHPEPYPPPELPTRRQESLLRQLAFAHAESVSHYDALGGITAGWIRRWQQVRAARRFLRGKGPVPRLQGTDSLLSIQSSDPRVRVQADAMSKEPQAFLEPTFEAIAAIRPAKEAVADIDNLLIRYVSARLQGRECFGDGYYGWPVFLGLSALWLSVAASGWLARYHTAVNQRPEVTFDDVAFGIGVVDRAVTRLPALGKSAERVRAAFLGRDDGLARLVHCFLPASTL